MALGRIYVVVPKEESVTALSPEEMDYAKEIVNSWVNLCLSMGKTVTAFTENLSVFSIVNNANENIRWQDTVGTSDKFFIKTNVADIPAGYDKVERVAVDKDWLKAANSKFKPKGGLDELSALSNRLGTAVNRSRFVANKYLGDDAAVIINLQSGNSFCNVPAPEFGDGKLIINIHPRIFSYEVRYGGALIDRDSDIINVILGGIVK